jgi:rubrerythrin
MNNNSTPVGTDQDKVTDVSRRRFFQLAGGIAGAGVLLSACHSSGPSTVYIGSGDTALLNYFYILEQLEAAFYTQAVATPYYGMDASEQQLLTDVRDHEIAHREFFKKLLAGKAIPSIVPNFSAITFADRTSVLSHAYAFEDLGVSAYNGAAELFADNSYAIELAKIVSVEARHAAYFRDILTYNSFADNTVIGSNGLDQSNKPSYVLSVAAAYSQTTFDARQLPN